MSQGTGERIQESGVTRVAEYWIIAANAPVSTMSWAYVSMSSTNDFGFIAGFGDVAVG
jgi:hypothetical protein